MYGLITRNQYGHVLISSEFESMHYAGRADYVGVIKSTLTRFPDYFGDASSQAFIAADGSVIRVSFSQSPEDFRSSRYTTYLYAQGSAGTGDESYYYNLYTSAQASVLASIDYTSYVQAQQSYISSLPHHLSGRTVHRYRIRAASAPLFFVKPGLVDQFHGTLQQFESAGYWHIDVIQGGPTSVSPIVYAFLPPSEIAPPSGDYGMATYLPDGRIAFDSRLLPLIIHEAKSVIPPIRPCDGGTPTQTGGHRWNDSTLDFNFHSNTTFNSYPMPSSVGPEHLMFSAPSVAQGVYSRIKNGYKRSSSLFGSQEHWSTAIWWAMYHSAYRLRSGAIDAGWAPYAAGYRFFSRWEGGGWFGGSGGSIDSGVQPYADKTINLQPNTIIVADSRMYA